MTTDETTIKQRVLAKQIIDGLTQGKTYTQISEEIGKTRQALYAAMQHNQLKQLMILEVTEMETQLLNLLQEFKQSTNPTLRKTAATELGKMIRHTQDKLYPTLFQTKTLTLTANINPEKQAKDTQILTETINETLPPTLAQKFWTTLKQKHSKYNQQTPNTP